ncbi:MAG: M23 family metallopeptidase [Ruminococcaceae bacterium]|nr:M23 family metallopeptidase [Oscillospiraceae bacterium]
MKKKYIVIFSLLFLLIPTYIVLSFIIRGSETPVNFRSLKRVEVISPNGSDFVFEANDSEGMSQLLLNMVMDKTGVDFLKDSINQERYYKVNFVTDLYNTEYHFILTPDPTACFIKYKEGVKTSFYKISENAAKAFLSTKYSEGVYEGSHVPVLTIGGEEIPKVSVDWKYKLVSGEMKSATEYLLDDEVVNIGAIATDFNCVFSRDPDNIDVRIFRQDTGETLYYGSLGGIKKMSTSQNHVVRIEIYAHWNEGLTKDCMGDITYVAYAKLHAPAYFYLSEPQVQEGELVVISAKNILDVSNLEFTCDQLEFKPKFFKDGEYYRAYVPIPLGILSELDEDNPKVTFKYKSDDSVGSFDLLILERSDNAKTVYNIEQTVFKEMSVVSNPYPQLYKMIENSLNNNTNFAENYLSGKFFTGFSGTATRTVYGTHIKYSSVTGMFRGYDTHYVGASTSGITTINSGKIVYKGEFDYTGGLVVVDHGFGLLSWYWNLGKFADGLKVGDIVDSGTLLGYNGGGGLTETIGGRKASVHIAVTVFDQPIDISPLLKEGIIITDK